MVKVTVVVFDELVNDVSLLLEQLPIPLHLLIDDIILVMSPGLPVTIIICCNCVTSNENKSH